MKARVNKPGKRKYIPAEIIENPTKAQRLSPIFQLRQHASLMYRKERLSTSSIAEATAVSLTRYWATVSKKELQFSHITVDFLAKWEAWMLEYGKLNKSAMPGDKGSPASITTCRFYLQFIKLVFNAAVNDGDVPASSYPFGKGKFISPKAEAGRTPRTQEEIRRIMDYKPSDNRALFYHDMWVLSFLLNGINAKDLCMLKWTNIDEPTKRLTFYREKVRSTSRAHMKPIIVPLTEDAIRLILRWANEARGGYLLPVFHLKDDAFAREAKKKYFIKSINDTMKKVAAQLGLSGDVRSYVARHSFSNILLQKDVPLAYISQQLGHSSIATTQSYIDRFSDEKSVDYSARLLG